MNLFNAEVIANLLTISGLMYTAYKISQAHQKATKALTKIKHLEEDHNAYIDKMFTNSQQNIRYERDMQELAQRINNLEHILKNKKKKKNND